LVLEEKSAQGLGQQTGNDKNSTVNGALVYFPTSVINTSNKDRPIARAKCFRPG